MTDWPSENAPLSEWLRPVSARLNTIGKPKTVANLDGVNLKRKHRKKKKDPGL